MIDIATHTLTLSTKGFNDIIDITPEVQSILRKSDFLEGSILVHIPGATAGITTIEYEGGLKRDLKNFFEQWIPMNAHYYHNDAWHDGNGYAHLRATLLKPSLTIPFTNKQLCLGTWQQIILVDFDNRSRNRKLTIQITGKKASS